jgi:hypothetical protein
VYFAEAERLPNGAASQYVMSRDGPTFVEPVPAEHTEPPRRTVTLKVKIAYFEIGSRSRSVPRTSVATTIWSAWLSDCPDSNGPAKAVRLLRVVPLTTRSVR